MLKKETFTRNKLIILQTIQIWRSEYGHKYHVVIKDFCPATSKGLRAFETCNLIPGPYIKIEDEIF